MNLYAWNFWQYVVYTITENPQPGDYIYKDTGVAYEYEEYHYNFINDWYYSNIIETVQTGATPKIGIRANKDRPEEQVVEFERNPSGDLEVEGGEEPENLVSKFVHDGVTYTIKDAQAREDIANILPDQTSQSGKFLTTNGITTSWETVSSGTTDYSDLSNKPKINNVELSGNKSLSDLGIQGILTSQNAYTSKGTSAKVAQISTNNLGQVTNITEVDIEAIKNQDSLRTTPIKVWTGDRANYKQAAFNNWISSTSPVTLGETFSQCYGAGKFLIIPGYYTDNNNYIYSTDGIHWTSSTTALPATETRIRARWLKDRFISLCFSGQYEYSFDGLNWETGTLPITDTPPWDIAYGNGKFVVVFQNSSDTGKSLNKVAYSEDGINWTVATITNEVLSSNYIYWRLITFFKNKFIAFRVNSSMVAYSEDAINWTTKTISNRTRGNYYWAANNGEICVACCNNRSRYATSTDGINWTERDFPGGDGHRHNVIYDGVRFVALPAASSETGQSSMVATVLVSTDGLNWTYSDKSVPVAGEYLSVTYGDNKIVAIENNTTNIITQEYTPLSTINPDYLCFVEDTKIQLGSNEIVNTSDKEDIANKVTSISASSTDTEYPTAKCVYDLVGDIESVLDRLITGGGVTNVNS